MSGIQQWSKNVQVQANPGKRVRLITANFSTPILAGAANQINLYAPVGYISRVIALRMIYPAVAGAASGNKAIWLSTGSNIPISNAQQPYNVDLTYDNGVWFNNPVVVQPSDPTAQFMIPQRLVFDETNPIGVRFENNTNLSDGGSLKWCLLWVEDEKITS